MKYLLDCKLVGQMTNIDASTAKCWLKTDTLWLYAFCPDELNFRPLLNGGLLLSL